ncbi:MAG: hypothetical protein H6569_03375 [Lewinellaceae bacterium]|nr:hypothetical protein [Lewinellaceae bacterium]
MAIKTGNAEAYGKGLTINIVYMGWASSLLTYANILRKALRDHRAAAVGFRVRRPAYHGEYRFALQNDPFADDCFAALALSLHAADDAKRTKLCPSSRATLGFVDEALEYFIEKTASPMNT